MGVYPFFKFAQVLERVDAAVCSRPTMGFAPACSGNIPVITTPNVIQALDLGIHLNYGSLLSLEALIPK